MVMGSQLHIDGNEHFLIFYPKGLWRWSSWDELIRIEVWRVGSKWVLLFLWLDLISCFSECMATFVLSQIKKFKQYLKFVKTLEGDLCVKVYFTCTQCSSDKSEKKGNVSGMMAWNINWNLHHFCTAKTTRPFLTVENGQKRWWGMKEVKLI